MCDEPKQVANTTTMDQSQKCSRSQRVHWSNIWDCWDLPGWSSTKYSSSGRSTWSIHQQTQKLLHIHGPAVTKISPSYQESSLHPGNCKSNPVDLQYKMNWRPQNRYPLRIYIYIFQGNNLGKLPTDLVFLTYPMPEIFTLFLLNICF